MALWRKSKFKPKKNEAARLRPGEFGLPLSDLTFQVECATQVGVFLIVLTRTQQQNKNLVFSAFCISRIR
jgi:hypothetical protein